MERPLADRENEAGILALVPLNAERHRISRAELDLLLCVPADRWVDATDYDPDLVRTLVSKGLLLSDSDDEELRASRERDEAFTENEWNLYGALYHFMTQWGGVEIKEGEEEAPELKIRSQAVARAHVAEHGLPPSATHECNGASEVRLPGVERDGPLYRTLLARRTTRSFDPKSPMTIEELDSILRYVFGCHGYARNSADVVCIKRTSPSGGGLHPIEVYPVISNVAGVAAGIYHYNGGSHSLAMLEALEPDEARRLSTFFMCGQRYFGNAHVACVLTARFYRNHWKYRRHQKAYAGILMDAAHLSQTLYLVSTELNLGAFVTIAINARDIEDRLGLDGVSEGVIAMTGCGRRTSEGSPLELDFYAHLADV